MKIKNNSYIKTVNVNARVPVNSVHPPIYGTLKNVEMSTTIILKCLLRRAQVFEVFEDGSTLKLNLSNYYTDNTNAVKSTPATKTIAPQVVHTIPANVVIEDDLKQDEEIADSNDLKEYDASEVDDIEDDESSSEDDEDEDAVDDEDDAEEISDNTNAQQPVNNNQQNNQNYNRNKKRKKKH